MKIPTAVGDGYGFESVVCGCSFLTVDPRHRRHSRRVKLQDALRYVVRVQREFGFDPMKPKTKPMQSIYSRIRSRLRLAGCKESLEFFVGVGTCIDCLGIDCFFRCGKGIVTIDLYSGAQKGKSGKVRADIVLKRSDFVANRHYQLGDRIAGMLLESSTRVG